MEKKKLYLYGKLFQEHGVFNKEIVRNTQRFDSFRRLHKQLCSCVPPTGYISANRGYRSKPGESPINPVTNPGRQRPKFGRAASATCRATAVVVPTIHKCHLHVLAGASRNGVFKRRLGVIAINSACVGQPGCLCMLWTR